MEDGNYSDWPQPALTRRYHMYHLRLRQFLRALDEANGIAAIYISSGDELKDGVENALIHAVTDDEVVVVEQYDTGDQFVRWSIDELPDMRIDFHPQEGVVSWLGSRRPDACDHCGNTEPDES